MGPNSNEEILKAVNIKIEELKKSIAFTIIQSLDLSIDKRAEFLDISKSELSRILNRQRLPSIERIFLIEEKLGKKILKIIPNKPELNIERSKSFNAFTYKLPDVLKAQTEELQVAADNFFMGKLSNSEFRFITRNKAKYLSFNCVPLLSKIGGYHLLTLQYYKTEEKPLRINFIVRNNENDFWNEVKRSSLNNELELGNLETLYSRKEIKDKNSLLNRDLWLGQPYFKTKSLSNEDITSIVQLAYKVYEIQRKKME